MRYKETPRADSGSRGREEERRLTELLEGELDEIRLFMEEELTEDCGERLMEYYSEETETRVCCLYEITRRSGIMADDEEGVTVSYWNIAPPTRVTVTVRGKRVPRRVELWMQGELRRMFADVVEDICDCE